MIGTLFSSAILFGYRGRRLADINPVRCALLGAAGPRETAASQRPGSPPY